MTDAPVCIFRDKSAEAYRVGPYGTKTSVTVWLCNWPEAHPEHFVNAPRWLQKRVYPGLAITPETDCINCPARVEAFVNHNREGPEPE